MQNTHALVWQGEHLCPAKIIIPNNADLKQNNPDDTITVQLGADDEEVCTNSNNFFDF